jgi:hypothetical protein
MTTIHNSDLSKELREGAKIQISIDKIPTELAEKVVPVMEVNPKMLRYITHSYGDVKTTTGSLSPLTFSSTKDTYLTNVNASFVKDATCDIASGSIAINAQPDGSGVVPLAQFSVLTTTAQSGVMNITLNPPMKMKRSSVLTITGTFTAGALARSIAAQYFEVDNPNA